MIADHLISYMKDPGKLDSESLARLEKWRRDFPFSQTLQLLYLLNLYKEKDPSFEKQLRALAASVADRARLKEWIDYLDAKRKSEKEEPRDDPAEHGKKVKKQRELEELEARILQEMNELEERRVAIRELLKKKEQIVSREDEGEKEEQVKELPRDKLLEDFLQQQEKKRPAFFNPVESARRSITDQPDVVSETLAQLYARQGHIKKAIEIYKVLSLKIPEKSSYFAAQIERLSKKQ